jgi:hypothetical protein
MVQRKHDAPHPRWPAATALGRAPHVAKSRPLKLNRLWTAKRQVMHKAADLI